MCAREIARGGFTVLVLEEGFEVGTPEHCSGLVSGAGLGELGIVPTQRTFGRAVSTAEIFAPNGKSVTVDAKRQGVIELSRRELDKQAALQAQKNGAEIRVNTQVQQIGQGSVRTRDGTIRCRMAVDARGIAPLIRRDREGALASAQYEVCADWMPADRIQVFIDQERYPGFFAWIIPSGGGGAGERKGRRRRQGDKRRGRAGRVSTGARGRKLFGHQEDLCARLGKGSHKGLCGRQHRYSRRCRGADKAHHRRGDILRRDGRGHGRGGHFAVSRVR